MRTKQTARKSLSWKFSNRRQRLRRRLATHAFRDEQKNSKDKLEGGDDRFKKANTTGKIDSSESIREETSPK